MLSHLRLIKVKTSPDVMSLLFQSCLPEMKNLTQLKLQGIPLGPNEVTDELILALEKHTLRLELLDLSDTTLTLQQLEQLTEAVKQLKALHSLDLSYNSVRDVTQTLVSNLCDLLQMLP